MEIHMGASTQASFLAPPAPWIELVIFKVLYLGVAGIHKHFVEVSARHAILAKISHGHPTIILVFAGLIVQIQENVGAQQPGSGIGGCILSSFAGFSASGLRAINICKPDPDKVLGERAILELYIKGIPIYDFGDSSHGLIWRAGCQGNQEKQRQHEDGFGRFHDLSGRTAHFTGNISLVSGILRVREPDLILRFDFLGPFAARIMVFI